MNGRVAPIAFIFALMGAAPSAEGKAPVKDFALILGAGCTHKDGNSEEGTQAPRTREKSRFVDSDGYHNPFKPQFELADEALRFQGWNTQVFYGAEGREPKSTGTERPREKKNWERPPGWKPVSHALVLQAFQDLLKNPQFTADSQLLVVIASHGEDTPEHSVCLGRDENGDDVWMPVKSLRSWLDAVAAKNHGKVALLDDSCYSGQTVDAFRDAPICTISSASPHTSGEMTSLGTFLFSLGLPRQASILNTTPLKPPPDPGSADLDGDGKITASEAFEYSRFRYDTDDLPRISDCALSDQNIRAHLDRIADAVLYAKELQPAKPLSSQAACAMTELSDGFKKLYDSATQSWTPATIARIETDLERMSPSDKPRIQAEIDQLQAATRDFITVAARARELRPPAGGQASLEQLRALKSALAEAESRKREVLKHLRPSLYFACALEKARKPAKPQSPCEKFVLFGRKPAATSQGAEK